MPTFKLKVFNYYSLGGSIMWGWILRVSWWQILLVCRNSLVPTWSNIPIKTDQCGWLLIGTPPTVKLTYLTFETFSLDQNSEMRASSHIIVSQMSRNQSCRRGSFFSWRGVVGTRDHCLTHKHKHCLTHKSTTGRGLTLLSGHTQQLFSWYKQGIAGWWHAAGIRGFLFRAGGGDRHHCALLLLLLLLLPLLLLTKQPLIFHRGPSNPEPDYDNNEPADKSPDFPL